MALKNYMHFCLLNNMRYCYIKSFYSMDLVREFII